jgi:hypothetical protein
LNRSMADFGERLELQCVLAEDLNETGPHSVSLLAMYTKNTDRS